MIDVLALPVLALLVVGFLAYVAVVWLGDKNGRALAAADEEDDDDEPARD